MFSSAGTLWSLFALNGLTWNEEDGGPSRRVAAASGIFLGASALGVGSCLLRGKLNLDLPFGNSFFETLLGCNGCIQGTVVLGGTTFWMRKGCPISPALRFEKKKKEDD